MKTKIMVIAVVVVVLVSELQGICFANVIKPQDYTRFTQESYKEQKAEKSEQLAVIVLGGGRIRLYERPTEEGIEQLAAIVLGGQRRR